MANLWKRRVDPPRAGSRSRFIQGGPLIDLPKLQDAIRRGVIGEDELWVATRKCQRDLENYAWEYDNVLQMLRSLLRDDYQKSEWCEASNGQKFACDVYELPYDEQRGVRNACGFPVYLKFSITERGQLTLVLISCHGP